MIDTSKLEPMRWNSGAVRREPLTPWRTGRPCVLCPPGHRKLTAWGFDVPGDGETHDVPVCLTCNDKPELRHENGRVDAVALLAAEAAAS